MTRNKYISKHNDFLALKSNGLTYNLIREDEYFKTFNKHHMYSN